VKIFLSGAIERKPDYKADFNCKKAIFEEQGFETFSPADLPPGWEYEKYLKVCIAELVQCDGICFVNDTTTSKGAFVERMVAQACGIREVVA